MAGRRSRPSGGKAGVSARSRIVWGSLAATMCSVGGLLWVLEGKPAPRLDGLALMPMVAAGGPATMEAVLQTRAQLSTDRWQAIVVHHSGSAVGTPAQLEAEHKARNLRGLGYHFVIGNGRGIQDGEVYVGYRWLDQLPGAHVAGPDADWYNQHAIGICLIGDGERQSFTDEQGRRLVELVQSLARALDIPESRILLHSDVAPTANPGRFFPSAAFRSQIASGL